MSETEKKKSPLVLVIIIGVLLVLLVSVSTFLAVQYFMKPVDEQAKAKELGPVYNTEEITVNLKGTGIHFLKTKITLELTETKLVKEIESKKPMINDKILSILKNMSVADLQAEQGNENLKKQLISGLNQLLTSGQVKNVYFTYFVYQ